MRLPLTAAVACMLTVACLSDTVTLERGRLGPASYKVDLDVSGGPAVTAEDVTAHLQVVEQDRGALLLLRVGDEEPATADLRRTDGERLELVRVQGVPPGSAGEADLASLVGQLDPPLADRPVRMGDRWSSTRTVRTESLAAQLTTQLELLAFRRIHGVDIAHLEGTVTGSLTTSAPTGNFNGRVTGSTRIGWAVADGRLVTSDTRLVWTIDGAGEIVLRTDVRPA